MGKNLEGKNWGGVILMEKNREGEARESFIWGSALGSKLSLTGTDFDHFPQMFKQNWAFLSPNLALLLFSDAGDFHF